MSFDRYDIFARLVPAALCGIPIYVLYFFLLRPYIGDFVEALEGLKIASDITVAVAVLFFMAQVNRLISKELFEKRIFGNGLLLPTTTYLMHSDMVLSGDMTRRVHARIQTDFGILIPSAEDEAKDETRSRQLIKEAVGMIRARVGKGRLLHQHNIEYGFARNLVGGSVLAIVISAVAAGIFHWWHPSTAGEGLSLFLLVLYGLILLFGKRVIRAFGMNYGEILIQEYLAL